MLVEGRDCVITLKTGYRELGVPYAEETIREAVSLLREEAAIEGDGVCRGIRRSNGVTGCVVTPLTIGTAPLLLSLALGAAGLPVYVSESRGLYGCKLTLLPAEESPCFDVVQSRGGERRYFEGCRVEGFELRIVRGEAVKLKLDIRGGRPPAAYPFTDAVRSEGGERFRGDGVSCRINGRDYGNMYGLTLAAKKGGGEGRGGTRTELWIKRSLEKGSDIPGIIDDLTVTAQLYRENYVSELGPLRYYGMFRFTLTRLVLTADETAVDCADAVIGPLRYYCAGTVQAEVFTNSGETLL
jgi:hypothetical protein